jgi:hypothetical protein
MSGGCTQRYVSGFRLGQPCPYRASAIVNLAYAAPFLVCGYHAKTYTADAIYPLDWSLARIRRWRLDNLNDLISRTTEAPA